MGKAIADEAADVVTQDDFLIEALEDQKYATSKIGFVEGDLLMQLMREILEALDWSGNLRREEGSKQSKFSKVPNRFTAAINIGNVVNEFESKKRDTQRKNDI
jgi:hypothetical protein